MKLKFFISHSSTDSDKISLIESALKEHEFFEPLIIIKKKETKKSLIDSAQKVVTGILNSNSFIPILTSHSYKTQWINQEIGYAFAAKRHIIPIVQKSIIKKLKGFIHQGLNLDYTFESSPNSSIELNNFSTALNNLVEYLSNYYIINIPSDAQSLFLKSETYPNLHNNSPVHVFSDGGYWTQYLQFTELKNSFWIAHNDLISDNEAFNGGVYQISRSFKIDHKILSAYLYLTVDDHCDITINNKDIGHYLGINQLTKIPIEKFIKKGYNTISFNIQNSAGTALNSPAYNTYINRKGIHNPYGIRFLIKLLRK